MAVNTAPVTAFLWLCFAFLHGHFATTASAHETTSATGSSSDHSLVRLLVEQAVELRDQGAQLKGQDAQLKQQVARMQQQEQELKDLETDMASMESELATKTQPVAFSAYISDEPNVRAAKGSAVPFRGVTVNTGGGYHRVTSAFTAPVPGDYYFIVHVDCSADFRRLEVTHNGNVAFTADNDNHDRHVTGAGLITLKKGDVVTTRYYSNAGYIDAGRESTFSGFLVK